MPGVTDKNQRRGRLSRRAFLRAGALAAGATLGASVVGCAEEKEEEPAAVGTPEASPGAPKRGGIYCSGLPAAYNLEPMLDLTGGQLMASTVYTPLFTVRLDTDELIGLAMVGQPEQPDELTYIFPHHDGARPA